MAATALCDRLRSLAAQHAEALIPAPETAQNTGLALLAAIESGCAWER